jgi:hypothetical protein
MARIIRLDKISTGVPVTFKNSIANLEQGFFLELKGLANDFEAYKVELAGANPTGTVVVHATPEMMYDERKLMQDFVLENEAIGRGFILGAGDVITIAEDLVTGSVSVGDKVGYAAGGKLSSSATTKVYEVLAKENFGGQASIVLHVL